jgi:hypothetical protein
MEMFFFTTFYPRNLFPFMLIHSWLVDSISEWLVFSYLLTPYSRVLLEKLTGLQQVKKFPAFYRTRRFITTVTSARHLSLSWASSIQSIPPTFHFLKVHLNIILPSTPGSPQWSHYLRFPHPNPIHASPLPIHTTCPAHLILLDIITRTILGEDYRSLSSHCVVFSNPLLPRPS